MYTLAGISLTLFPHHYIKPKRKNGDIITDNVRYTSVSEVLPLCNLMQYIM